MLTKGRTDKRRDVEKNEQALLGDANPATESVKLTGEVNGRKICTAESTLI